MVSSVNGNSVTFKRAVLEEKDLLFSHLLKNPAVLYKDFRFIEPLASGTNEFLIGATGDNRLHLVEVVKIFDEGLLYRSLSHLQWMAGNASIRENNAPSDGNKTRAPGIIYVLPECPHDFLDALEFISSDIPIKLIKYAYLESEQVRGFLFEPVDIKRITHPVARKQPIEEQIASFTDHTGLTREEIMKFLT